MFLPSSIGMLLPRALLDPVDESVFYPAIPSVTVTANSEPTAVGVNVGMSFIPQVTSGTIHSLCYYRVSDTMSADGTMALWQTTGLVDVLLAEVDYTGHSGTGWQVIPIPGDPIPVSSSNGYVVHMWTPSDGTHAIEATTLGFFAPRGYYSAPNSFLYAHISDGQFDTRTGLRRNGLITVGAFARPTGHFGGGNYWVDVIINARPVVIPPPPPLVLKWPMIEGYPSAETTGADPDTPFEVMLDPASSTADGEIIEDMDFRAGLTIQHNNVTLRNCILKNPFPNVCIINTGTTGAIIEDCTFDGVGRQNLNCTGITVGGTEVTIRRVDMYRIENGIAIYGHAYPANVLVEDSFIHNLRAGPGFPHYDGVQMDGGQTNVTFRHNTIFNENSETSAIMQDNLGGPIVNTLIEDNYLCGGGYTAYADESFGPDAIDTRFYNNILRPGMVGGYFNFNLIDPETSAPDLQGNQYLSHGGLFDAEPPGGFADGQIVPESFFGMAAFTPAGGVVADPVTPEVGGITLGLSFTPLVDGEIASVNFYRPSGSSTVHHKVGLWRYLGNNVNAGTELLWEQDFPNVIRTGLQNLALTTPVPVIADQRYLVGVWTERGSDGRVYRAQSGGIFWPDTVPSQWGRLVAFAHNSTEPYAGFTGKNGMYTYGPDLVPPLLASDLDANYYVDPVFVAPWADVLVAHGTADITLGALTLASTGVVSVPPPGTAWLLTTFGSMTLSAAATVTTEPRTADLTTTLGAMTLSATCETVLTPRTATLSRTLGSLTLVAAGVAIPSPRIATLSRTLGTMTLAAIAVNSPDTALGNASNTGVPPGTVLTASGAITTSSNGQIIQDRNVSGRITVNHNNVTIRRCRITVGSGEFGIHCADSTSGTIIEDCEIAGTAGNSGINGGAGTWRRLNIHGFENGVNVTNSNGRLLNSWLHGIQGGPGAHHDTVQIDGEIANWEIGYCTLENLQDETSCVMIDNFFGFIDNIDVHDCVMICTASYAVYSDEHPAGGGWSGAQITNVKVRNNRMDPGFGGYVMFSNNTPIFTGNTDRLTGAPISA